MKHREEGYIGELLLSKDTEVERTCLIISQVIKKGTLKLEEALDLYEVSMETYLKYTVETIAFELNKETSQMIGSFDSKKQEFNVKASLMSRLVEILFSPRLLEDAIDKKNVSALQSDLKKLMKAY